MADNERLAVADPVDPGVESVGGDDVERALTEWEASPLPELSPEPQELKGRWDDLGERRKLLQNYQLSTEAFRHREEELQQYAGELARERDLHDVNRFLDTLSEHFPQFERSTIETLLSGLLNESPGLLESFKGRYAQGSDWPGTAGKIEQHLRGISQRLPDPDLTADREAVAHAVRSASGGPREAPPPNLGKMSDDEFREHTEREYGFTPLDRGP